MNTYAFTDDTGNVGFIVECHLSQIDIQPQNEDFSLRFDVTGQNNNCKNDEYLLVDVETGKIKAEQKEPEPDLTSLEKEAKIRDIRNELLSISDWTQIADSPADEQQWKIYRQNLRNISEQEDFPNSVIWPNTPTV
jgi:hypothetical protein